MAPCRNAQSRRSTTESSPTSDRNHFRSGRNCFYSVFRPQCSSFDSAALDKVLILLMSTTAEGTHSEQNQGLKNGFCSARAFSRRSLARPQAKDHQSETARRQYFVLTSYLERPSNT